MTVVDTSVMQDRQIGPKISSVKLTATPSRKSKRGHWTVIRPAKMEPPETDETRPISGSIAISLKRQMAPR